MKAAIYRHHSITLIALATLLSYPLLSTAADKAGLSVTIVSAEERTCGRFVSAREDAMRGNQETIGDRPRIIRNLWSQNLGQSESSRGQSCRTTDSFGLPPAGYGQMAAPHRRLTAF